ncbi:MAG: hypothetical protein AABY22_28960, partial [Nanoarchaeota archaeon]
MSWTDKQSIRVIIALRDKYSVIHFVETGSFKGVNAQFHSENFEQVISCEKVKEYYQEANKILRGYSNVKIYHMDSKEFLQRWRKDKKENTILFLDAHFYDPR